MSKNKVCADDAPSDFIQQQIEKENVRTNAFVQTPFSVVNYMLDLVEKADPTAFSDLDKTILDPAVGYGRFPYEALKRKLKYCKTDDDKYRALKSIYSIDIQKVNVDITKQNLYNLVKELDKEKVYYILDKNIICGDSLKDEIAFVDWRDGEKIKYINKKPPKQTNYFSSII